MLTYLQNLLQLSATDVAISAAVILFASLVRGFSGFGLSALIMAGLALIMPPVALIPVCFLLEAIASALLLRGGFKLADYRIALGLTIGSALGLPIGLAATVSVSPDVSRVIALILILILSVTQIAGNSPAFLNSKNGLYISGLVAGVASGLAGVGGMVVALYVLTLSVPVARMRASLVMFLFIGTFTSGFWLGFSGLLNTLAFSRAIMFAPIVITGVLLGSYLFRPGLQDFYRIFCLCMLIAMAAFGLLRLVLSAI